MNLLHIIHRYHPAIGGAEKYMQEISERFASQGDDVTVFTTNALDIDYFFNNKSGTAVSSQQSEEINGVKIQRFPIAHFPLRKPVLSVLSSVPSWHFKCLYHPYQMVVPELYSTSNRRLDISLVHASASPFTSLLYMAYRIAKKNNVPFIITPFLHLGEKDSLEVISEHIHPHQIRLLKCADAIFASTKAEKDYLISQGMKQDKVHVLGVGINPALLKGGDGKRFRQKYNIAFEEKIIAHISRWDKNKGTLQLLEAAKVLSDRGYKFRIVLIGSPTNDFSVVWSQVPDVVKKFCLLLEHASEEEKNDVLDAMDIFCMPSIVESFGIVYFESWFYKKPVIGADIPAVREIIGDSKDGFLVKFGSTEPLVEKISLLLDNPSLALQMGETGYQKTFSQFLWDQKFPLFISAYHKLISKTS